MNITEIQKKSRDKDQLTWLDQTAALVTSGNVISKDFFYKAEQGVQSPKWHGKQLHNLWLLFFHVKTNKSKRHLSSSPGCTPCGSRSLHSGMCRTFHELQLDLLLQAQPLVPGCQYSNQTHTSMSVQKKLTHLCKAECLSYLCVAAFQEPLVLHHLNEVVTDCRLKAKKSQTGEKKHL